MKKMSMGARLFAGLGVMAVAIALLGGYSVFTVSTLRSTIDGLGSLQLRNAMGAGELQSIVHSVKSAQMGMMLAAMTGDAQRAAALQREVEEGNDKAERIARELEGIAETEAGRQKIAAIQNVLRECRQASNSMAQAIREQKFDEATRLQSEVFYPLYSRMNRAAAELVEVQRNLGREKAAAADSRVHWSIWIAGALSLAGFVLAGGSLWLVRHSIGELRGLVVSVSGGAREVGNASGQVSSSSQALAQGASEQAASLEETSASTEEINSMTQKNADNARQAASETEESDQLLQETNKKLEGMIASMREINGSSEKVSKIIKVIDEIAFQTNILALNAAVEAARAGEAGMGFAVVADEVRNLAQRCTQAARDTSELIEESIARSGEGKSRLDEVAEAVRSVVEKSGRIRLLVNEVHVGSQEQARGIEQIARAIEQMQRVTQSTAASAEQSASAGQEMSAQALELNEAVRQLNGVLGQAGSPAAARTPPVAVPATSRVASVAKRPALAATGASLRGGNRREFPMDDDFRDFE
jgi:methyl-accepting chemotaxis protein/methyl-accepting chemotaxis protein-1 (serine sensor receptor)